MPVDVVAPAISALLFVIYSGSLILVLTVFIRDTLWTDILFVYVTLSMSFVAGIKTS